MANLKYVSSDLADAAAYESKSSSRTDKHKARDFIIPPDPVRSCCLYLYEVPQRLKYTKLSAIDKKEVRGIRLQSSLFRAHRPPGLHGAKAYKEVG